MVQVFQHQSLRKQGIRRDHHDKRYGGLFPVLKKDQSQQQQQRQRIGQRMRNKFEVDWYTRYMGFDLGDQLKIEGLRYERSNWLVHDYFTQPLGEQDSSKSVHKRECPHHDAKANEGRGHKDKSPGILLRSRSTLPHTKVRAPYQQWRPSSFNKTARVGAGK